MSMLLRPGAEDLRLIGFYLGKVLLGLGIVMLVPAALAVIMQEWNSATAFVIGASLCLIIGAVSDAKLATRRPLTWAHGMVIVALAWLVGAMFAAIPMYLSGRFSDPLAALFEAMSAVATGVEGVEFPVEGVGGPLVSAESPAAGRGLIDGPAHERVVERFWSSRLDGLAMGLDADKRPLEVASSNMGHALWTGVLEPGTRQRVAQRVTAPDLFESWGIRTLGSREVTYSPLATTAGRSGPTTRRSSRTASRAAAHGTGCGG
jgi:hypothetical protein